MNYPDKEQFRKVTIVSIVCFVIDVQKNGSDLRFLFLLLIVAFVKDAKQFDDITMLAFKYNG